MPIGDLSEKQNHVSSFYGADTSLIPASFDVALYTGNPYGAGVETDYPGYARVTITNDTTTFVNNADGTATATVTPTAVTDPGDPTFDWDVIDDIQVWVLFNGTAIDSWDFLETPIPTDGPGVVEEIEITPYVPDAANVT